MIKYLGSKRVLLPAILDVVRAVPGVRTVVDLCSGTSRVGHALKRAGYRVLANDHNAYAHALARCYVAADHDDVAGDAARLIAELNALPGRPGWFTATFCEQARFVHPKNGARIDAIRDAIAAKALPGELEAVLLVALLEAADRVDSTTGVQMAYLKQWAPRAHLDLQLRLPAVLPRAVHGKGEAHCRDAIDAAGELHGDLLYVDPPYNQHSYLGNYHVWESLVRWDRPPVYGVARKRIDCRDRRSPFNSRRRIAAALAAALHATTAHTVVVSFNDEGFLARGEVEALLASLWSGAARVQTIAIDHARYVGARIGIHNPRGEKVGTIGRLRNVEHLFVASRRDLGLSVPASPATAPAPPRDGAPATAPPAPAGGTPRSSAIR